MSELVKEPTDAEFSAMMDQVAPNREKLVENAPEPVAEEPAVAAEIEPTVDPPEVELPEKYQGKSAAEIARMHSELEQRLGQQGTELGGLRSELAQIQAQLQQEPETPPWESFQSGTDALDEAVLTNPKETLEWIRTNQPQLYERAITTWSNIDPFGASRYDNETKIAAVRSEYETQLAAVRAPVVASQNDAMLQTAYTNVANANPLLATVAEDIPALLEANPEYKVLLGHGDVPTRERALQNLVRMAAFDRGMVGTQVAPAENAAQTAQAKKIAATVASPGSSAERGDKTTAQAFAEKMLAAESTSVADELARSRAAYAARQAAR